MASKSRGLDVPNYWINLYYLFSQRNVPSYFKDHSSPQMKIKLNTYFHRLRNQFKLPPYELKPLILYRYVHNPLGYSDIRKYGNIYNMASTVRHFRAWKNAHKDLIDSVGILKAINETAPEVCEVDYYLMEQALKVEDEQGSWI